MKEPEKKRVPRGAVGGLTQEETRAGLPVVALSRFQLRIPLTLFVLFSISVQPTTRAF
jgi:hypothetical protein